MRVLEASNLDKNKVLDFCKNTFSWGDYVDQIWDYWISEGNLLVIHEEGLPVAMCHASLDSDNGNMWIEGIRVNPEFRRQGYAKNLIQNCEKLSKEKNCNTIQMLIETNNSNSLRLSKTQGYHIKDTWNFYSLDNNLDEKEHTINFIINTTRENILLSSNFFYVDSWRWYPITNDALDYLAKEKRIIFSEYNSTINGIAVFTESKHFEKTLLVTILDGNDVGISNILSEISSISKQQNFKRIQILTNLKSLPKFLGLEHKLSFNLVEKNL